MRHYQSPVKSVPLIAINDGVPNGPFPQERIPASRKIPLFTGTVIYGYLWNEARDQWLVDPEAADVVKRIFAMTIDGYGPYQIASKLKSEKVLIPSAYLAQHGEGVNKNKTFKDVYGWGSSTICNILEKREYLGHTINFKTRKHFKDKKSHYVPEDEWTIFENTHEAIIDQQTFDLVQKIRGNVRRYPDGWGEAAPLTGLLYCADCGGKMYVHRTNNGKRISQYTCSQYSKVPVESSARPSIVSMKMWYCPLFPKCSKPLPSMRSMTEPSLSEWYRKRSPASRQQRSRNSAHALPPQSRECPSWKSCSVKSMRTTFWENCPTADIHSLDAQYAKEQSGADR